MSSALKALIGVTLTGAATFGLYSLVTTSSTTMQQIRQIDAIGTEYEQWAIQNPVKVAEILDGEPYSKIVKDILNEEPAEGLEDINVFYIGQNDEQYGICISNSWDNADGVGDKAYIYSTVIERTVEAENCIIEPKSKGTKGYN